MQSTGKFIWSQVLDILKESMPRQSFETWLKPVEFVGFNDGLLTISVSSKFFADWLREHHLPKIREAAATVLGVGANSIKVEIVVKEEEINTQQEELLKPVKRREKPALNPRYTFDSFVVGPCNQFAHAASLAVAQSPARAYNPLFVYGGVGLGKTHLMQAIGHYVYQHHPEMRVVYVSCEKFTNQLIDAIRTRTTLKFRDRYRSVDLLLIDDIHFLANKESTQEEFFHTFNALYDAHKQIVISSDRPPKEIPTLEERLVSRFEWGLVTDIQPPDLETRVAILKKKSEEEGVSLPEDVALFIANRIKYNIRELEGALIRVIAYASLVGRKIDTALAKDVLKDVLAGGDDRPVTIDLIQRKVADYFNLHIQDLKARKRTKSVAVPRQIAMFLARELTDFSLLEIGDHFGGRDHTTVLHACGKIEAELQRNELLRRQVDEIRRLIKESE